MFPIRIRDYSKGMPVRMRQEALKSALLSKLLDQEVKVLDQLSYDQPKTKRFATTLKNLGMAEKSCLVAVSEPQEAVVKSIRNMARVHMMPARNLNAYDLLKHKHVLLTKETVEALAEVVKS